MTDLVFKLIFFLENNLDFFNQVLNRKYFFVMNYLIENFSMWILGVRKKQQMLLVFTISRILTHVLPYIESEALSTTSLENLSSAVAKLIENSAF